MSLINQVLNDLEKRGVTAAAKGGTVRAVPVRRERRWTVPVAAVVILGMLAAGWWAMQQNTSTPVTPPAPAPVADMPAAVVAAQQTPPEPEEAKDASLGDGKPAMRLSLELSSIPLPSSLRTEPAVARKADDAKPVLPPETTISKQMASTAEAPQANVNKQIKQVSAQQQLENEFRKATALMQQGRSSEALAGYEAVLKIDAGYEAARQALAGLLLEGKRNADAERVLQEGLAHNPKHAKFAMLLARLQVERNALPLALETLQKVLPYAERQADYRAFIAALLQRQERHDEAIAHYQAALQLSPDVGAWLVGMGISLQALKRNAEARDAYKHAMATHNLNAGLQDFVERRLKELRAGKLLYEPSGR